MGMTMTQKILAKHAGLDSVTAGQLIEANVDLTLANDITGPVAIREMEKAGFSKVFDNTKIALVMDHFAPNKDTSPQSSVWSAVSFRRSITSLTSSTSAQWASSMRCSRKKV